MNQNKWGFPYWKYNKEEARKENLWQYFCLAVNFIAGLGVYYLITL